MHTPLFHPTANACRVAYSADLNWRCAALSVDTVRTLADEWDDLAQNAIEPNIFQHPDFLHQSIPLLDEQKARIVTIRYAGRLIGLVILRRDMGYAKLPVPFWRSAIHPEQYLGTPLVRAGFENQFVRGLTDWLDQAPLDCGFVQLAKIPSHGPVATALLQHSRQNGRAILIVNQHERAAIAPNARPGNTAEDHLSSSRRKSLRKAKRRLEAAGAVSIERLSQRQDLDGWIDQFLTMEDTGWKRQAGSSILSCAHETAIYQTLIRRAFEDGNLHLTRLKIDERPIAYTLDILAPPVGFCLKSAIDPAFRKHSPGVLMEFETLKFYLGRKDFELIDSCTHPDNALLNELWPDKRTIMDLAIARRGPIYSALFAGLRAIKTRKWRLAHG